MLFPCVLGRRSAGLASQVAGGDDLSVRVLDDGGAGAGERVVPGTTAVLALNHLVVGEREVSGSETGAGTLTVLAGGETDVAFREAADDQDTEFVAHGGPGRESGHHPRGHFAAGHPDQSEDVVVAPDLDDLRRGALGRRAAGRRGGPGRDEGREDAEKDQNTENGKELQVCTS
ncbi:MAG: hypothetical protein Q8P13_01480 [bacterium]|nr:hypothetical protein [bacterium]